MIVAAMLDAGLDSDFLVGQLDSLGVDGLKIEISPAQRCGIGGLSFKPTAPHQHHHRKLADIVALINGSSISDAAKQRAIGVFGALARVEGGIHGKSPDEISFHEVGAVDSIADIVAACVGLDALGIEKVCCSPLAVGSGTVKAAHGQLPVPAPATAEILRLADAPIVSGGVKGELLTPTGAALLTNFTASYGPLPPMKIEAIGYGAGTRDTEGFPNLLRLFIGEAADSNATETDCVALLETNIDDATGETVGFVIDRLLATGALDVFTTATGAKQSRPAVMLSVICKPGDCGEMEHIIFTEGLTLGIRKQLVQRSVLNREIVTVETEFGPIKIKTGAFSGKVVTAKPEYADCAEAAKKHSVPLKQVRQAAIAAFDKQSKQ